MGIKPCIFYRDGDRKCLIDPDLRRAQIDTGLLRRGWNDVQPTEEIYGQNNSFHGPSSAIFISTKTKIVYYLMEYDKPPG
jgi:hypothetical protein